MWGKSVMRNRVFASSQSTFPKYLLVSDSRKGSNFTVKKPARRHQLRKGSMTRKEAYQHQEPVGKMC